MNNAVRDDWTGKVIGFHCRNCGGIFQAMWGEVCNGCREKERRHQETLAALRALQGSVHNQ